MQKLSKHVQANHVMTEIISNCMQVVHGGNNDVLWLQRDFHIYMVNVFDTEKACQVGLVRVLNLYQSGCYKLELPRTINIIMMTNSRHCDVLHVMLYHKGLWYSRFNSLYSDNNFQQQCVLLKPVS